MLNAHSPDDNSDIDLALSPSLKIRCTFYLYNTYSIVVYTVLVCMSRLNTLYLHDRTSILPLQKCTNFLLCKATEIVSIFWFQDKNVALSATVNTWEWDDKLQTPRWILHKSMEGFPSVLWLIATRGQCLLQFRPTRTASHERSSPNCFMLMLLLPIRQVGWCIETLCNSGGMCKKNVCYSCNCIYILSLLLSVSLQYVPVWSFISRQIVSRQSRINSQCKLQGAAVSYYWCLNGLQHNQREESIWEGKREQQHYVLILTQELCLFYKMVEESASGRNVTGLNWTVLDLS